MNKLKDIFYNKNDILIILLILVVAGFLIWNRIDTIMSYPSTLVASADQGTDLESEPAVDDVTPEAVTDGSESSGSGKVEMYAVYIDSGESLQSIAAKFVSVGLFKSTDEFIQLANQMGITTKIKAGNFIMPSNSTPEEVMNTIIKPGL